jgi:hypothetical protein
LKRKGKKAVKKPWDDQEDNLLKQYYGQISMKQLKIIFEGRTEPAIQSRVKRLRKKGWSFDTVRRS